MYIHNVNGYYMLTHVRRTEDASEFGSNEASAKDTSALHEIRERGVAFDPVSSFRYIYIYIYTYDILYPYMYNIEHAYILSGPVPGAFAGAMCALVLAGG